jgi:hypothetical protein
MKSRRGMVEKGKPEKAFSYVAPKPIPFNFYHQPTFFSYSFIECPTV